MTLPAIADHYAKTWGESFVRLSWTEGPVHELPENFYVLRFPPNEKRGDWIYATAGMSPGGGPGLELHLRSLVASDELLELLTIVVHYHCTGARLDLGHIVNLGRPWLPGSGCDRGLISLPYIDGPAIEDATVGDRPVRCLWLLPITDAERLFAKAHGLEELERRFEAEQVDYANPRRASVV